MTLLKYSTILTFLLILSCTSSSEYLLEANEAGNKGNYREAIILLDKAIAKNPKFKDAYLNRGICNENLNRLDSAINDYNKLLKFDPKNTSATYYIGLCKYKQNKFAEAVEYFNKALWTKGGLNPSDTGHVQITIDYNKNGLLADADNVKFDIAADEIYYQRGLAYYQMGNIGKAYSDFMNCIGNNYYVGESHYMVGLCYLSTNQKVKACEEFNRAILYGDTTAREMILKNCP